MEIILTLNGKEVKTVKNLNDKQQVIDIIIQALKDNRDGKIKKE